MYYGDYINDQKHGWGVYRWADGRVYIGEWINGNYADERTYILPNGQVKKAKWTNNKKGAYIDLSNDEIA
jgi:hypothetical protein